MNRKVIQTPAGEMELISDSNQLLEALFIYEKDDKTKYADVPVRDDAILLEAAKQLDEYFLGNRQTFSLPLKIEGTPFQKKVWDILNSIPYGEVLTYKQIAEYADSPKACRAAGGACRENHFTIIIPCHRVLGTNGSLTGYSGDKTFMKKWLLDFEKEHRK